MDKYEELKLLQTNIKRYIKSCEEELSNYNKNIKSFTDIKVEDISKIEKVSQITEKINQLSNRIKEATMAQQKLENIEIAYCSYGTNIGAVTNESIDKELKRNIYEFKKEFSTIIGQVFQDLAYENGAWTELKTEEEEEEFLEELEMQLESGKISKEDYEALQYGIGYCSNVKPLAEEKKSETVSKESISYRKEVDIGDNSLDEFNMIKNLVSQYMRRESRYFSELGNDFFNGDLGNIKAMQENSNEYQNALNMQSQLKNLEMLLGSASTLPPEEAQQLFSDKLLEFKKENFDSFTKVMSDSYSAIKENMEYRGIHIDRTPGYSTQEDVKQELNDLLHREKITQEEFKLLSYTQGYYGIDGQELDMEDYKTMAEDPRSISAKKKTFEDIKHAQVNEKENENTYEQGE